MALKRMDNVGIVVDDLAAAVAFFVELGMELEGQTLVEGPDVDRLVALDGVRCDIAMVRTPDGHSRLELMSFRSPVGTTTEAGAPTNTPGIRRVMFAVDDLEATLARLRTHGAEPVGDVVRFGGHLLCNVRGPEGIVVALAENDGA